MTVEIQSFRRVLIVADESADWIVAGLRQLERLALSVDEFAFENKEKAPVLVCIFWKPELDPGQRWIPKHERLARITFTTELTRETYDLTLNTRLFLYRKAIKQLLDATDSPRPIVPAGAAEESWADHFYQFEALPTFKEGVWEYIRDGSQIDEIEKRFLRGTGKSQDGLVSRYLNRPISRLITRLFLRFPTTPNAWTIGIFSIAIIGTLILLQGSYWSVVWGLVLFQLFSVLDGCDGEIARAKFLESERGRQLDDLFDVLSNVLLVIGLGFGLTHQARAMGRTGWFYLFEGLTIAAMISLNEFYFARSLPSTAEVKSHSLDEALYPRHRSLVERSGLLRFGERFVFWVFQLTKRDVAILFFVVLALIGSPSLILHLLFLVSAISLLLALRSRG